MIFLVYLQYVKLWDCRFWYINWWRENLKSHLVPFALRRWWEYCLSRLNCWKTKFQIFDFLYIFAENSLMHNNIVGKQNFISLILYIYYLVIFVYNLLFLEDGHKLFFICRRAFLVGIVAKTTVSFVLVEWVNKTKRNLGFFFLLYRLLSSFFFFYSRWAIIWSKNGSRENYFLFTILSDILSKIIFKTGHFFISQSMPRKGEKSDESVFTILLRSQNDGAFCGRDF